MPLDTRCTVKLLQDDDSYVDIPLWTDERKASEDDFPTGGTIRNISIRHFVIRYNLEIAQAQVSRVYLVDNIGRQWNADAVDLSDDRRRFITIRGVSENTGEVVVPETPVDPDDPLDPVDPVDMGDFALADTVQAGIRRYARTINMINTADFYEGVFPRRMRATFVNNEVILDPNDGPRSTFSQDEVLDEAEINVSGGPVGQTGRLFDAPENAPSEAQAFFVVYWVDRGGEPDSIVSFDFV